VMSMVTPVLWVAAGCRFGPILCRFVG
jgi:hypothetical protein